MAHNFIKLTAVLQEPGEPVRNSTFYLNVQDEPVTEVYENLRGGSNIKLLSGGLHHVREYPEVVIDLITKAE